MRERQVQTMHDAEPRQEGMHRCLQTKSHIRLLHTENVGGSAAEVHRMYDTIKERTLDMHSMQGS